MKSIAFSLILACVLKTSLQAQTNSQPALQNTNAPAASVAPTVIARTLNSRTWARIISQTNTAGVVSSVTNKAYTELASGLCYEKDGQLVDSVEQIDIEADGASATQAQHKVHFAGNANTAGGAVILNTRDGKTFASRVYGLSYWDTACGTNILLAALQDCQGTLVGTNRVVYTNAFNGLNADLEYVFTKAGLEQNVILREQLPAPESLGLAAASTRLQVLTEFMSPPAANKTNTQVFMGIREDTLVNFGAMGIGMGKAFYTAGENGTNNANLGRVSKHWMQLDGRDFLFEEVPYKSISNAVQNLPLHSSAGQVGTEVRHFAALEPLVPQQAISTNASLGMQLAKSMPEQPGVVLDYTEFDWAEIGTNLTFQSDTTYYINGNLLLDQTPVFEGGTVIKFESSSYGLGILNCGDSVCVFNGSDYRPVICTSSDDDSVGDRIADSSGSPSPRRWLMCINEMGGAGNATNVTIAHVRFSYFGNAYQDDYDASHIFQDCQFVQCVSDGYYATLMLFNDTNLYLQNVLFAGVNNMMQGDFVLDAENITVDAENVTVDSPTGCFWFGCGGGGITNSILTGCNSGGTQGCNLDHTVVADSGAGIYQSVGDGNYYLAPGTYQGGGTANINPSLLADLQTKTTYPPVVFASTTISGDTNLGIAAPRDTSTSGPDIGYHYTPLDYVFGGTTVNGNLTFSNGVAVGWYNGGYGYGILMGNSMNANFQGTASAPDWWVRCNTVQESGGNTVWPGAGAVGGLVGEDNQDNEDISVSPQANLVFTHCSILASGDGGGLNHFRDDYGYLIVNAEHSEFYGGILGGYVLSCYFTNCFLDRMGGGQVEGHTGNAYILTNCTWHGGWLVLTEWDVPPSSVSMIVRDSAFDGTQITASDYGVNPSYANYDFNAFGNGAQAFPIDGASNVFVTNGFNWQSSWLGNYYLPSDSPLIQAGDVTADQIGLSAFTTQTNQTPEGTAIVDIGYHYWAMSPGVTCIMEPGGQLAAGAQSFCIGEPAFDGATWTDLPGLLMEIGFDGNGNTEVTTNVDYSTILTNWNVVDWEGDEVTSGGSGFFFTPTNAGVGTNVFYYTYSNSAPCGGTYTISISNTFVVVAVASLAPANTGTWMEMPTSTPGTRTFVVQANPNAGQNTLEVDATPTPYVDPTNLPACWSLNGAVAETTNLDISVPAVYEVNCVCGASSLTDFFVVTTNAITTNAAAMNSALDAPCGTGPLQLGYWSFIGANLLDCWAGQSNALDSAGTNNGTIYGTVTYTNGVAGEAFNFNGSASYISFGPNAGNFGTNNFTIDFWMRTTGSGVQSLLGKRPYCGCGSMWDMRMGGNGCLAFEICQDDQGTFYTGFWSQGAVNDGNFHHITINRTGTAISLYIDGTNDTTVTTSGVANVANSADMTAVKSACVGCDGTGYFTGALEEIKLFQDFPSPWASSRGWPASVCYDVLNPPTPWTNGAQVDCTTNTAELDYNYLEADGSANLNGAQGAVSFWFSPDWNGGSGPGAPGYLIEFGDVYSSGGGWAVETDPNGTGLSFVSGSNGDLTTYFTAAISGWVQNQWHQIVLNYSSNQTALFIDGATAASGPGLAFEPDLATRLADGFTLGSDHNGCGQARGVFDELATYNCPLAQSVVVADYGNPVIISQPANVTVNNGSTAFFPVFGDSATPMTYQWQTNQEDTTLGPLTNSDRVTGVTSNLLSIADVSDADSGTSGEPLNYSVILSNSAGTVTSACVNLTVNDMAQLGFWNFAATNWAGQQGQLPLLATNVSPQAAWFGLNGVQVDSSNTARLVYRDVETNGSANINCRVGSIVLWFNPDWSSQSAGGNGPQDAGRFIELGSYGATNDWWALLLGSDGNSISFVTETNGVLMTIVTGTICWTNNTWHQVLLTYSSDDSWLVVDNQNWFGGNGVTYWPRRAVRDQGMSIGSDATGTNQMRGVLADLETFNYELQFGPGSDVSSSISAIETGGVDYDISLGARFTSNSVVTAAISGWPSAAMAISVNNSNPPTAWGPFNPNPSVNLGTGDGPRTVTFFFNCLSNIVSSYSLQIWVDTTPPAITITSPGPGTNTVNQPILQLQGYAPEELAAVTYDIANSAGTLTNQPGVVMSRFYDTNLGCFTTNTFQCFDLDLTLGANEITVYAKDLAGNMSTNHFTYTLDYTGKTNPVLGLYWPVDGSQICGTNFTWRGTVDDPTVSLSAQIVDSSGDTNVVNGLVERNGNFWVENLPLASGTKWLTLTATDAAGNVSSNNIAVVQSLVNMTFTSIPDVSNQVVVTVQGTIDTSGYSVWVNGVQASESGVAPAIAWEADNVPVNGTGTTVFQARAIPNSQTNSATRGGGGTNSTLQNPGNPVASGVFFDAEAAPDYLPGIICTNYTATIYTLWTNISFGVTSTNQTFLNEYWALNSPGYSDSLSLNNQGYSYNGYFGGWEYPPGFNAANQVWDQFGNGSTTAWSSSSYEDYSNPTNYPSNMDMTGRFFTPEESDYYYSQVQWNWQAYLGINLMGGYTVWRNVASSYVLRTGGKATSHRQGVFQLAVTAENWQNLATASSSGVPTPTHVAAPYSQISVMGQPLGNDNNLFVSEPDGITVPIPVDVPGSPSFTFNVIPTKYEMLIQVITNGTTVTLDSDTPTTFCVGQNLQFQPAFMPVNGPSSDLAYLPTSSAYWTLHGPFKNTMTPANGNRSIYFDIDTNLFSQWTTHCWYYDAFVNGTVNASIRLNLPNGAIVPILADGRISIYRPSLADFQYPVHQFPRTTLFGGELRLGDNQGGSMQYNISVLSSYAGRTGIVQLVNQSGNSGLFPASTEGGYWLDNTVFTEPPFHKVGTPVSVNRPTQLHFTDPPGIDLGGTSTSISDQFQDYVVFQPSGDESNIYVTLGTNSWSWIASTTLRYVQAPAPPGSWAPYQLVGVWAAPISYINPPNDPVRANTFAFWTNILKNK